MRKEIRRRKFIKSVSVSSLLTTLPIASISELYGKALQKSNNDITKVHLLFKTHLDIGFTDLAAKVLEVYFNRFLPSALALAKTTRLEHLDNRFVWTTGSWLIYEYLERSNKENRKNMEEAISAGDVVWHGLPFTMHTELLSSSMLNMCMNISKILDSRFDKKTIAAKMTDVPGHTRSLVPLMREQGLEFLHIGVNPASTVPGVPALFNWQAPGRSEIMVMYQGNYGGVMTLPDKKTAVSIVFTGDNHGPQTQKEVIKIYKDLQKKFPNAELIASDLNKVASDLLVSKDTLPVVTEEIGDTWIHGPGSDPLKIAQFREMIRFRENLLKAGVFIEGSPEDMAYSIPLAMVAEHTWGMNVNIFLKSWDIYRQDKFEAARNTEPFQIMEKSWKEKRAYIETAINSLEEKQREEAHQIIKSLTPIAGNYSDLSEIDVSKVLEVDHFRLQLDSSTGAIVSLIEKTSGREWADTDHPLALFAYQTFNQSDYDRFHDQYLRIRPQWATADFGKPGLESGNPVSKTWLPKLKSAYRSESESSELLILEMNVLDDKQMPPFGCPKKVVMKMEFLKQKPEIYLSLSWFDKQAIRLPEAIWFSFVPKLNDIESWSMDKSGQMVNPENVVKGGARKLHSIQSGIQVNGKEKLEIVSLDGPIVAPGERNLLNFDNNVPNPDQGMHFCLLNNVWGTNFTMWFEDDMKFRFKLKFG